MSDAPTKNQPSYPLVRDQAMPSYHYPTSSDNGTVTVRNASSGSGTRPSVLVNGHIAY